jgi:CheY-like chemotaxis protein
MFSRPDGSIRLLLVEDNPADALIMRDILEHATCPHYHLVDAGTLSEGLAAAEREDFDVVLLDLMLPDAKGLETLRRFLQARPALPIVCVSGINDPQLIRNTMEAGAREFILKQ